MSKLFRSKLLRYLQYALSKIIPFPYCMGWQFFKTFKDLERSQWLSSKEIEKLQIEELSILLEHVYQNVPYYQQIFKERSLQPKDFKSLKDLEKLPILTKSDVREHFKELCAQNFQKFRPWIFQTGGSTGKPLKFYLDKKTHFIELATLWRYRYWAGYKIRDRLVNLRYRLFKNAKKKKTPYVIKGNLLFLSSFHLKEENLADYVNLISKFQPKAIYAFPSAVYILAKHINTTNTEKFKHIHPVAIFTASETLFDNHRQEIEKAFNCKIYNWYGSNENVISAAECPEGNMHINSEKGILEIVDNNGINVPVGQKGKVVGTSLTNFAMSLIRYEIGDIAALSDKPCPCGRGLPLIKSLEGRIDDMIVTKNGSLVGRLDESFHDSYGIKMSQIIQERKGHILIKIVKDKNFSQKDINILDQELRKRLGTNMDIDYKFVSEIPRTDRGKHKFVISKIANPYHLY